MTEWAPLVKLQASEARRQLAERAEQLKQEEAIKAEQLALEKDIAKEEAISGATRALKVKMASERLDENSGGFMTVGVAVILVGGVVLLRALAGDDAGSSIYDQLVKQVRTQQMTNGILIIILGYIITKR